MMTRVFLVVFTMMTGGATYASVYGIGGETSAIAKSIRSGSGGRVGYIGGVK